MKATWGQGFVAAGPYGAGHHLLSADADLARSAGFGVDRDLDPAGGPADAGIGVGSAFGVPGIGLRRFQHGNGVNHLRLAVGDADDGAEDRLGACIQAGGQHGGAAIDGFQPGQHHAVRCADDLRQHGGGCEHLVHLAALDQVDDVGRVHAVQQHDGTAHVQVGKGEQAGAVGEWRHQQKIAIGPGAMRHDGALQQVAHPATPLAGDDALRQPCRARGESDPRPIVHGELGELGGDQRALGNIVDRVHREVHATEQARIGFAGHDVLHLGESKAMAAVGLVQAWVQGQFGSARQSDTVACPHRRYAVADKACHRVTRPDPGRDQPVRQPGRFAEQPGVGDRLGPVHHRDPVCEAQSGHGHGRRAGKHISHSGILRIVSPLHGDILFGACRVFYSHHNTS